MYLSRQNADFQVTIPATITIIAQALRENYREDAPQVAIAQIDLAEGEMRLTWMKVLVDLTL